MSWRLASLLPALLFAGLAACRSESSAELSASAAERGNAAGVAAASAAAVPVHVVRAQSSTWVNSLAAAGSIAPAQEVGVSAELAGARILKLMARPGDSVRRGQTLAILEAPALAADGASAENALREATRHWEDAREQLRRAKLLQPSGAISAQVLGELASAEATAEARLNVLQVRVALEQDRRASLRLKAPADALVLSSSAVVGTFTQAGEELYRLVPEARMIWRAELPAAELNRVHPGQKVTALAPDGRELDGRVRGIAPALDAATRLAVVEVELPPDATLRIGEVVRGVFHLGERQGLTLPLSAVQQRDGVSRVFVVRSDGRVQATPVRVGQRLGPRIEIAEGLSPDAEVVSDGIAFLVDGVAVRVVGAAGAHR